MQSKILLRMEGDPRWAVFPNFPWTLPCPPMHSEEALLEDVARLESKLKAVRRKGNLAVESQICNLLGKKYELLGEWKEALTFHYFDSEIAAAMDDYEGQLVALNNTALVYRR